MNKGEAFVNTMSKLTKRRGLREDSSSSEENEPEGRNTSSQYYSFIEDVKEPVKKEANNSSFESNQSDHKETGNAIFKGICVILFMVIVAYYLNNISEENHLSEEEKIDIEIDQLRKQYPAQEETTWVKLFSVMKNDKKTVQSLILLYGDSSKTASCLAKATAHSISKLWNGTADPIEFDEMDIKPDYGITQEIYAKHITNTRTMIVEELNKVPSKTARIFHGLCDEVSPRVKPASFIFTLQ